MLFCAAFCSLATAELSSPLPPPPLLPPPSAPKYEVNSTDELMKVFSLKASADVVVASGTIIGLDKRLVCKDKITVAIRGSGEGATIDGKGKIGLFKVSGGCSLTLERLNLVNGNADGGAVHVKDGNLGLIDSHVANCKGDRGDWGGALYVDNFNRYKVRVKGSTFTSCSAEYVRRHLDTMLISAEVTSAPTPNAGRRSVRGKWRGEPERLRDLGLPRNGRWRSARGRRRGEPARLQDQQLHR